MLNHNYSDFIKPKKLKKKSESEYKTKLDIHFPYNYNDINKAIKTGEAYPDKRIIEVRKFRNYEVIYEAIVYKLSLKYNPKKNIEENIKDITIKTNELIEYQNSNFIEYQKKSEKIPVYSKFLHRLTEQIKKEFRNNDIFRNSIINKTISPIKDLSKFSYKDTEILLINNI